MHWRRERGEPLRAAKSFILSGAVLASVSLLAGMIAAGARKQDSTGGTGEALYRQHCASCHDAGISRAPSRAALGQISREGIRLALTSGSMAQQGANLSSAQIDALTHFLSKLESTTGAASGAGACPTSGARFLPKPGEPEWNGWGVDAAQNRFQL